MTIAARYTAVTNPEQLLRSVYLGDRACKGMFIDSVNRRFEVVVDLISRIRSPDGLWHYYSSEDIPDGRLVFEGVTAVSFDPPGPLPNDYILDFSVEPVKEQYIFRLTVASVEAEISCEVLIKINASGFYLYDPKKPGVRLQD